MSYKVENLENSMAKITIEVSVEDFEAAMTKSYNKNKNRIMIPGFRKGKAPRKMIEKIYGAEIFYEDAADFAMPDAYKEAADECGLDIVSRPDIDIVEIESGKPFIFTATVALKPEVQLGDYKGLEVQKQDVKVVAADVNAEIDRVREQNARLVTVEDRSVQADDIAVIDFEGFVDGEPFEGGKGEDYSLTIGSHTFIDTFEDQLIGKNAGDQLDVNVTFPEEYHVDELKGKPALFKVNIKELKVKELPELDDEFASEVSEFETMDEYKADLKAKLSETKQQQATTENENNVVEKVVSNASMEIPEAMIEEQVNRTIEDYARRMRSQGLTMEQYMQFTGMTADKLKEEIRPQAEKRIRTRLVLEAVAEAEKLEASEDAVEAEIRKMAENYKMEPDRAKELLGEEGIRRMKEDLAVQEAIDFLVAEAQLV